MAHVQACARRPVAKLLRLLPAHFIQALEQNQQIASCCRHPENHEIEARYSSEAVREREKIPDVYIFHCTCGRQHRRFMVGSGPRPVWDVR
jgi:hypothetical protein